MSIKLTDAYDGSLVGSLVRKCLYESHTTPKKKVTKIKISYKP